MTPTSQPVSPELRAYIDRRLAELIWEKRDGKNVPVAADPVSARRFVYHPDTTKLHFWDYTGQVYGYPGVDLTVEFPNRFIQFQPRVLGTGAGREGLMRPLIWASMLRSWRSRSPRSKRRRVRMNSGRNIQGVRTFSSSRASQGGARAGVSVVGTTIRA